MKLKPEQQQQVQTAKVAGENRVNLEFTAEQKANWQYAASEAQADRDATVSQLNRIREAATQPGVFGDLRRAISFSRRTVSELAAKIGVETKVLSQFRTAEGELPADDLGRGSLPITKATGETEPYPDTQNQRRGNR